MTTTTEPPDQTIRVCDITLDGTTLTVRADSNNLAEHLEHLDDDESGETTYTLTFRSMSLQAYLDLPDFDGF